MKNCAKWFVLVLCLVLCLSIFSGCGNNTPTDATVTPTPGTSATVTETPSEGVTGAKYMKAGETYRILIWDVRKQDAPLINAEGVRGQLLTASYNKMKDVYGVTPTWVVAPAEWIQETLDSAAAGSPITDLFYIGGPFTLPTIYTYGGLKGAVIESLDDYTDLDFTDGEYWNLTGQAIGTFNGVRYLIAPNNLGFDSISLNKVTIFNKRLVQQAGYNVDDLYTMNNEGRWTFEEFKKLALACTDLDNEVYGTSLTNDALLVSAMVIANGSDVIAKKNGVDTFNMTDAKALEAVNFLVKMVMEDKSILLDRHSAEIDAFSTGQVAMLVTYVNRLLADGYKTMEDECGVLMPPKGPSATDYISDMDWLDGYVVLKNTPNPAGSMEFANIFLKPAYAASSEDNRDMLIAQAEGCRLDEKSIETLLKVPTVTHSSSHFIFWSLQADKDTIGAMATHCFDSFATGAVSPDTYYASVEGAANSIIQSAMGSIYNE